ncbi:hypothetical protein C3B78_15335 [Arthrobacter sp. PGP41]|uniref:beta strand repeat-containing protein n=1 Tax=Arthrobacter sp. PGP41 TaxID=2079227 RepID=UPI000CDC0621|nr:Ig-like domain-containing protein [Arthrobacter sp. PGP41]AUZ35684.1 hypothetical protein C3B78_15335 [Arthrobacter sp. PGP41]
MTAAIRKRLPGLHRAPSKRPAWVAAALLLLLGTGTAAFAFWASSTTSSNATAAADTLSPGAQPAVAANGASLSVTWAAGTTVNGQAATGYAVTRYSAATGGTGTPATGGCAGTVATLTCTEQDVPAGIWYYTVTPTIALWTGAESPRSDGVSSDAIAPAATVSAVSPAPNAAGWNSTSPVTVTITADDGAAGSGVASITYAVDGGAEQTESAATATVPVSGDGTHTITYFATDALGNSGAAQSYTVRIDTTAPAAPGLTVPAYVSSANAAAVPVTGTSEAGAEITLTAGDGAQSVTVAATASGTGSWSASPDLSGLAQGTVTFTAAATDAAGNTGTITAATSTKDTVAPAPAQALVVPAYVNIANAAAIPVSGTAEAGGTVTVAARDSSGQTVTNTATASGPGGGWSLDLDLRPLNQGTVTYTVTVTDPAGNTGAPAFASDVKDTVAPALTITAPMYVNSSTATGATVNGTTEAGTVVTVTVRDSMLNSVPPTQATPSGTSWSATLDLSSLRDGTLTYTASTSDAAGNSTTAAASGTTGKDTVAPAVTGVALAHGGGNQGQGKADKGDTVTITYSEPMDPAKFCPGWNGASINGTATVANGSNAANDTISFTGSTCTAPNIGAILLGGNYVGTNAAVFGANGTASTLTWDSTARTLTIKLGNAPNGQGAVNTSVVAGTPTYSPAPNLTDLAGNPLGTGSFTAAAASGF